MSHRKTLSRLTIASLAAAALAAPAATAMPTDPSAVTAEDMQQVDARPSTPTKQQSAKQDLRTEAASGSPRQHPPYALAPTWPEHPQPIARVAAPPVADADGGGDDAPVLLLVIGGALVLAGGTAVTAARLRTRTAH
jgi:hypothetical protein